MPELADLHFLRPAWLLLLIPAMWLLWRWARLHGSGSHWQQAIAPELLTVLLEPGSQRGSRTRAALMALLLTIAALGLAGPSWERLPQPVEQRTDALVIVLDLSLSMFAEDVAPSRMVRARQKIADVLRRRDEGFTALVAYAGDAHAVVPLTDDVRTIENLLPALAPDMMPVLGSELGAALDIARDLLDNARMQQGRILVITDGIDRPTDATERRDPRFPISVLGIGTDRGAPIPLDFANQPGQVLRTQQGEAVLARLDVDRLAGIADVTHGRYHTITLGDRDVDHLLATPLPGDDETVAVERDFDTWADQGYWVCLLILPLLLSAFRRGTLVVLPLLVLPLLLPAPAQAGLWDDLWQRRDQQAHEALTEGDPATAAALFEDAAWRAAALYRAGEYEAGADAYERAAARAASEAAAVEARYNLGNALAHAGELDAAIAAYQSVLEQAPDHDDARHNKALLEELRDEQNASDQNDDSRQQPGGEQPDQSSRPDAADQPAGGGDDPPADEPPPDQAPTEPDPDGQGESEQNRDEQREQESLASRDEQQDALEQWLRRVPDDPGGLLRRKFQYETNQRLRRGDYRAQDSEKIW
ncbi:MAG: VWA domain-containing protein [Pseudomonadales bacterium]